MSTQGRSDRTKVLGLLVALAVAVSAEQGMASGKQASERIISGVIVEGGVECPLFKTDDGEVMALDSYTPGQIPTGTRMRLKGHEVQFSFCSAEKVFTVVQRLE